MSQTLDFKTVFAYTDTHSVAALFDAQVAQAMAEGWDLYNGRIQVVESHGYLHMSTLMSRSKLYHRTVGGCVL